MDLRGQVSSQVLSFQLALVYLQIPLAWTVQRRPGTHGLYHPVLLENFPVYGPNCKLTDIREGI